MKTRPRNSLAAAVTEIRVAIGEEACAKAVGRSRSLVRKWADPDHSSIPNMEQALALDLAFVELGHGEPPLLRTYSDRLSDVLQNRQRRSVDILLAALSVQSVVGDLSEAIKNAVEPNGPGGRALTAKERANILELIDRLEDQTDSIEDTVDDAGESDRRP